MPSVKPDPSVSQGSCRYLGPQVCQGSGRHGRKGIGPQSDNWCLPGPQPQQFPRNGCRLRLRARGGAEKNK